MRRRAILLLAVMAVTLVTVASPAWAATLTVNRTGDGSEPVAKRGDGVCDARPSTAGNQCTLRAAIQEANANNDATIVDLIRFNIVSRAPVKTISPARALPPITEALTINGYTQQGAKANTLATGNNAVLKIQLNGTNAGTLADGLVINASNSTIKGLVINRFLGNGVSIHAFGSTGNKVQGNFIGTNARGTADLGNSRVGVEILDAEDNAIGGTAAAARNIISGNGTHGVLIAADHNKVQGNYIGTKKGGTQGLGNGGDGMNILSGSNANNIIGGTASGAGNLISSNDQSGIDLAVDTNKVLGNAIKDNTGPGVFIFGSNNTIGGATGNQIFSNGGDGVWVESGTANAILSNRIHSNAELGIDLDGNGVNLNDPDDPSTTPVDPDSDTGANNLQNFPVITSATSTGLSTTIRGTLNSDPSQNYTIQCFTTETGGDASGHGEGQTFLAETTTATDTSGDGSFSCGPILSGLAGQKVSATATNTTTGDTSEFSENVTVGP